MEHIYVAEGSQGLLKVGKTKSPTQRIVALRAEFIRRGERLVRFHSCGQLACAYYAEQLMISALAARLQRERGREWFRHGNFACAVRAAEEITAHITATWVPISPRTEADEAWFRAHREERDRSRAWCRALRQKAWAAVAMRRRLRRPFEHAFFRIAAELVRIPDPTWPHAGGRPCIDVAAPVRQAA